MNSQNKKVLWASVVSVLLAAIVLVTVVLPAEYNLDPLGTGEVLGVLGLSRPPPSAITNEQAEFNVDSMRFELAPFESVEYKYRLEQDASLVFAWTATGEVLYDFHAEPDGAEPGFAESFEQSRSTAANGTYIAPFPGIHGWFWENRGTQLIELELVTAGFYSNATEFRDGDSSDRSPQAARDYITP